MSKRVDTDPSRVHFPATLLLPQHQCVKVKTYMAEGVRVAQRGRKDATNQPLKKRKREKRMGGIQRVRSRISVFQTNLSFNERQSYSIRGS